MGWSAYCRTPQRHAQILSVGRLYHCRVQAPPGEPGCGVFQLGQERALCGCHDEASLKRLPVRRPEQTRLKQGQGLLTVAKAATAEAQGQNCSMCWQPLCHRMHRTTGIEQLSKMRPENHSVGCRLQQGASMANETRMRWTARRFAYSNRGFPVRERIWTRGHK